MGSFSLFHWIIVLVVVLLLFGPKRLPDLAKGVGEAIREFKKAANPPATPAAPPTQMTHTPPPAQLADKQQHVAQTQHVDHTPKS